MKLIWKEILLKSVSGWNKVKGLNVIRRPYIKEIIQTVGKLANGISVFKVKLCNL